MLDICKDVMYPKVKGEVGNMLEQRFGLCDSIVYLRNSRLFF